MKITRLDSLCSRRNWLGSALGACGGFALSSLASGEEAAAAPEGYTKPQPVTDLTRAPELQVLRISEHSNEARTYALVFGKGDEILSGLTAFATKERVMAGFFTAIGAFQRAKLGWFDAQMKAYREVPVAEQAELVSLLGDVGVVQDKPQIHAHAAVALRDGTMRGGHLLEAIAWPTVEVFFETFPAKLRKEHDSETDLSLFNLRESL